MIRCPKCDSPWRNPVALAAHISNKHDVSKEVAWEMADTAEVDGHGTVGCSYCKRKPHELHTPGCKNPKSEGRRGEYKVAGLGKVIGGRVGGSRSAKRERPPKALPPTIPEVPITPQVTLRRYLEEERTDLLAQVAVVDRLLAKVAGG